MKVSVELPVKYLELSYRLDYDFIIADTCLKSDAYKDFYKWTSRFKILDNGAFETGEAIKDHKYIALADEIRPNILIIPDVARNALKTMQRSRKFMEKWKKAPIDGVELMGVIQADGSVNIAHELGVFYNIQGINWVGVPYISGLDRYQLIKGHPEWKNVHILGLPILSEILGLCKLPNVRSIDTSLPVKVTKDNDVLGLDECIMSDTLVDFNDICLDIDFLGKNIDRLTKICKGELWCHT